MAKADDAEMLEVNGHNVRVSSPAKPYFTRGVQLTKLDIVRYFLSVAPGALRGIVDRPVVLKRFVNGAEAEPFYQKRAPSDLPEWMRTVTLSFPSGRTAEEVVVDEAAGLAWIVQSRLHGASPASCPYRRPRPSKRTPRRSRPSTRHCLVRRPLRCHGGKVTPRRPRPRCLAEDQRLAWHPHQRAHRAPLEFHRSPPAPPSHWPAPSRSALRSPAASGGRKSVTASSSTTTRTQKTAPPAPPTLYGHCPTPV